MIKDLNTESIVVRKTNQLQTADFGDDIVMMDTKNGKYISLNKSGKIIWAYLEQPIRVNDLILKLMQKYKVEEQECTFDTLEYLKKMLSENMVVIC